NNVTFNNLFLKINTKNGGRSHHLSKTSTPFIYDSPTIIMGADVTHPSPGSTKGVSIASLCTSKDLDDGVSEGQFEQVLDNEVKAIKDACHDLSDSYKPELTVVIVQKRHHIRLAPIDPKLGDNKTGNCLSGTVVDSDITHPNKNDFS
ncbi:16895_t:CDS:2, partial [Dentiscutata heterogama]